MSANSLGDRFGDRSRWRVGDVLDRRYHVTGVLGSGGMGEVYLVRHLDWDVDLAVKSPHAHLFREDLHRELFVAEAETWVSLGLHPNVCGCHYVQVIGEVPRVFAEYVPGGSLHELIQSGRLYRGSGDAVLRVLDLAIQAARGLAHAHRRGVAHLDVKPANILLDAVGTAKITDFGLARAARSASEATQFTNVGMMTRAYASPEQAGGRPVGRRSDVYSFAVTVLEMLLRERTWMLGEIAAEVLDEERGRMPDAVAEVLRRCLAHDPAARPSMDVVAADLATVYTGLAGVPYPRTEPVPASLLADELNNRGLSLLDLGRHVEADEAFTRALDVDPRHLESTFNRSLLRWRRGELTDLAVLAAVTAACPDTASGGATLDELLARVHRERGDTTPTRLEKAPDTGTPRSPLPARLTADGARLLTGGADGGMRLWDLPGGRMLARLTAPGAAPVHSLDLSADARFALSAHEDNSLGHWDLTRRRRMHTIEAQAAEPRLTPDGAVAVWTRPEGTIRMWDTESGTLTDSAEGHAEGADRLEPSPLGRSALSSGWERTGTAVRLWDLRTLDCLGVFAEHRLSVTAMAFAPDGRTAAIARTDGTVELWDPWRRTLIRVLREAALPHLAFDPTGGHLLTGSEAGTVQLWHLHTGRLLRTFTGVAEQVGGLHVSAGARAVYAVSARHGKDVEVRVLEPGLGYRSRPVLSRPRGHVELAALDARTRDLVADARDAMATGGHGEALALLRRARAIPGHSRDPLVLDAWRDLGRRITRTGLRGGWRARSLTGPRSAVSALDVSPDGRIVAAGDHDGVVHVWNCVDGSLAHRWEAHGPHLVAAVRVSPDGTRVLTAARGAVRVWCAETGECLRVLPAFALHDLIPLAVTADGTRALVGGGDGRIHMWDMDSPTGPRILAGHDGPVRDLTVGAAGRLAVSAGADRTVRVWDLGSGECVSVLEGHRDEVHSVGLSPDARSVLSYAGRFGDEIRAWDLASNGFTEYATPPRRTLGVRLVDAGRFALSVDRLSTLSIWDTASRAITGTVTTGPSTAFATDAEGDIAVTGDTDGTVRIWHLDWELGDLRPG
ncbi:hypothetical protein Afil01_29710 [Actinorhabdospora filicis]|uniref:Protein kinase domain-containing protein n=1 Tax=Actinorhabdospora filicis TaxID=1785913 RepID=A0A9W6SJF6_9ACTN|nr:protein kinase [Actinorhabdospora filicis]GLZ78164.1 hypothetical protein Afil01_29710 [Actinorhabdospora filicis]